MAQITKEQARRLRNDFECWQQDYDPKEDKEQYDMFGLGMAAMDMLIAGMYQEPVAWDYEWASCITCEGPQDFKRIIEREAPPEWAIEEGQARNIIPLFNAPPAPIVPDECPVEIRELMASHSDALFHDGDAQEIWNACRAAMLSGGDRG